MSSNRKLWIEGAGNRSDRERTTTRGHALKIRRLIEAWEFVSRRTQWTYPNELPIETVFSQSSNQQTKMRQRKRILYSFFAAGLIEISPWPPEPGKRPMFRVRRKREKVGRP